MAFYLLAPLIFVTLFLSMYIGVRVRLLRKEIANLELCREELSVQLHERRRLIVAAASFGDLEPYVRRRGLRAPVHDQILAFGHQTAGPAGRDGLPTQLLEFLTQVPAASAASPRPVAEAKGARR